ncbi:MAG: hypothetical protein NTW79_04035 [Candidatus Berkelbacteria bacterium]|nr:hypothetical protein [Candidatus Berkelbacteria bacterium]
MVPEELRFDRMILNSSHECYPGNKGFKPVVLLDNNLSGEMIGEFLGWAIDDGRHKIIRNPMCHNRFGLISGPSPKAFVSSPTAIGPTTRFPKGKVGSTDSYSPDDISFAPVPIILQEEDKMFLGPVKLYNAIANYLCYCLGHNCNTAPEAFYSDANIAPFANEVKHVLVSFGRAELKGQVIFCMSQEIWDLNIEFPNIGYFLYELNRVATTAQGEHQEASVLSALRGL